MGMGSGIVLFVIGAILTFALNVTIEWIDLNIVGYLLMGAGALIFLIALISFTRSRRPHTVADPSEPYVE